MVTENNAWLKTNESKTETEYNGDWKNAWYKANELNAETEHNGGRNNTGIKPLQEKQKMNIMVTEIMHAKKTNECKKHQINVNINPTTNFTECTLNASITQPLLSNSWIWVCISI